jgi:NADH-quinone oxidoreductase subunit M
MSPRVEIEGGESAIELAVVKGGHEGSFVVKNTGDAPTTVRLLPSSEQDPRLPASVSAGFDGKGTSVRLEPGVSQKVVIKWVPSTSLAREVYGQVVLDIEGAGPRFVGVHGELRGGVAPHLLSLIVVLPLLAGLVAAGAQASRRLSDRAVRRVAVGAAALPALAVVWLWGVFEPAFGRAEGNEGLQFIERAVLSRGSGVEWFLGVDGATAALLGVLSLGGLAAAAVGAGAPPARSRALQGAALSAFSLLLVSQDLAVSWVALLLGVLASLGSLASQGPRARAGLRGVAALGGLSLASLGVATWWLSGHVQSALLLDGSTPSRCFSLPSMVRTTYLKSAGEVLGMPIGAPIFVALCLAGLPLLGVWPAGALGRGLRSDGGRPEAALLGAAFPAIGALLVGRIALLVVPEAVGWAAPTLGWLGAGSLLLSALGASGERDLGALGGRLAAGLGALALIGLSGLTPQGISGAFVLTFAAGLGSALLALAASWMHRAAGTTRLDAAAGLLREAPGFGGALAASLVGLAALPGGVGLWGVTLALFGALPTRSAPALLAAVALCVAGWSAIGAGRRLLGGAAPPEWHRTPSLEPHGGRLPELRGPDALVAATLVVVLVGLGLAPRPLLSLLERSALDLSSFVNPPGPAQVAQKLGVLVAPTPRLSCGHARSSIASPRARRGLLAPWAPARREPLPRGGRHRHPGQAGAGGLRLGLEAPRHGQAAEEAGQPPPELPLHLLAPGALRDLPRRHQAGRADPPDAPGQGRRSPRRVARRQLQRRQGRRLGYHPLRLHRAP